MPQRFLPIVGPTSGAFTAPIREAAQNFQNFLDKSVAGNVIGAIVSYASQGDILTIGKPLLDGVAATKGGSAMVTNRFSIGVVGTLLVAEMTPQGVPAHVGAFTRWHGKANSTRRFRGEQLLG